MSQKRPIESKEAKAPKKKKREGKSCNKRWTTEDSTTLMNAVTKHEGNYAYIAKHVEPFCRPPDKGGRSEGALRGRIAEMKKKHGSDPKPPPSSAAHNGENWRRAAGMEGAAPLVVAVPQEAAPPHQPPQAQAQMPGESKRLVGLEPEPSPAAAAAADAEAADRADQQLEEEIKDEKKVSGNGSSISKPSR